MVWGSRGDFNESARLHTRFLQEAAWESVTTVTAFQPILRGILIYLKPFEMPIS